MSFRFIILCAILIAGYFAYQAFGYRYMLDKIRADTDTQFVVGNGSPTKINIMTYIDYASYESRRLHPFLLQMMSKYPELNILIRPIASDSAESQLATRIALAAKSYGRFLDVHNIFMSTNEQINEDFIEQAIESLGMDYNKIKAEALSPFIEENIVKIKTEMLLLNIPSLPYFYIGYDIFSGGNYEIEDVDHAIQSLIKSSR